MVVLVVVSSAARRQSVHGSQQMDICASQVDGWMLVDKCWWIHYRFMWVNVWMDEWVNGWKDRRIDGWMDELGGKLGG